MCRMVKSDYSFTLSPVLFPSNFHLSAPIIELLPMISNMAAQLGNVFPVLHGTAQLRSIAFRYPNNTALTNLIIRDFTFYMCSAGL